MAETTVATVTRTVKKGLVREKDGYHYYIKGKTIKNKWKKIKGRYYWFKSDGVADCFASSTEVMPSSAHARATFSM